MAVQFSLCLRIVCQEMTGTFLSGMVDDLMGIALLYNKALIHEDQLVRNIPGKAHFVRHNHHRALFLRQLADCVQDFAHQLWIQR